MLYLHNDTVWAINTNELNQLGILLGVEEPLMERKNINFVGSAITLFKAQPQVSGVLFCSYDLETIIAYAIDKGSKLETAVSKFPGKTLMYIPEKKMVITLVWKKDIKGLN
jgi:hypothetical protein